MFRTLFVDACDVRDAYPMYPHRHLPPGFVLLEPTPYVIVQRHPLQLVPLQHLIMQFHATAHAHAHAHAHAELEAASALLMLAQAAAAAGARA